MHTHPKEETPDGTKHRTVPNTGRYQTPDDTKHRLVSGRLLLSPDLYQIGMIYEIFYFF